MDKPESPNHLTAYVTCDLGVSSGVHSVGSASPGMGLEHTDPISYAMSDIIQSISEEQ